MRKTSLFKEMKHTFSARLKETIETTPKLNKAIGKSYEIINYDGNSAVFVSHKTGALYEYTEPMGEGTGTINRVDFSADELKTRAGAIARNIVESLAEDSDPDVHLDEYRKLLEERIEIARQPMKGIFPLSERDRHQVFNTLMKDTLFREYLSNLGQSKKQGKSLIIEAMPFIGLRARDKLIKFFREQIGLTYEQSKIITHNLLQFGLGQKIHERFSFDNLVKSISSQLPPKKARKLSYTIVEVLGQKLLGEAVEVAPPELQEDDVIKIEDNEAIDSTGRGVPAGTYRVKKDGQAVTFEGPEDKSYKGVSILSTVKEQEDIEDDFEYPETTEDEFDLMVSYEDEGIDDEAIDEMTEEEEEIEKVEEAIETLKKIKDHEEEEGEDDEVEALELSIQALEKFLDIEDEEIEDEEVEDEVEDDEPEEEEIEDEEVVDEKKETKEEDVKQPTKEEEDEVLVEEDEEIEEIEDTVEVPEAVISPEGQASLFVGDVFLIDDEDQVMDENMGEPLLPGEYTIVTLIVDDGMVELQDMEGLRYDVALNNISGKEVYYSPVGEVEIGDTFEILPGDEGKVSDSITADELPPALYIVTQKSEETAEVAQVDSTGETTETTFTVSLADFSNFAKTTDDMAEMSDDPDEYEFMYTQESKETGHPAIPEDLPETLDEEVKPVPFPGDGVMNEQEDDEEEEVDVDEEGVPKPETDFETKEEFDFDSVPPPPRDLDVVPADMKTGVSDLEVPEDDLPLPAFDDSPIDAPDITGIGPVTPSEPIAAGETLDGQQPIEITVKCDCGEEGKEVEGDIETEATPELTDIMDDVAPEKMESEDVEYEEQTEVVEPVSGELAGDPEAQTLVTRLESIKDSLLGEKEIEGDETYQLGAEISEYVELVDGMLNKLNTSPDEYVKDQAAKFVQYFEDETNLTEEPSGEEETE